jgi:ABC-2 type transport system ATP-binding protein
VPAAIEIRDLRKSYDDTVALQGIDLTIEPGEFYGLLGPNGAGKTTTIGLITGLVRMEKGSISVFGKDIIRDYRFTRSKIGLSPQEFTSDWFFSIERLLIFQAGYYGIPKKEAEPRVIELLEKFGLAEKRETKMRQLSGGMKRRFQIAKALVNDPDILILDEPTAGVDVELRHMLWDLLRELHQQGKTILLTTHYIEEAEQLCEHVSIINDGFIVSEGTPQKLISSLGKGVVEVSLSGWDGSHEAQMSDFDFVYEPETDGDRLIFSVDNPGKELPRIVAALSSNGCHIHEVKINKSSLEDVFVAMTGRGIND